MKLANINRDYMVIIDVKSGSVNKPTMVFYNTDKNTSNIYAQLVVKETIVAATPIENATDYSVELKVVKPGNIVKFMDGVLVNEEQAIYEFDLPEDFTNLSGNYDIEFWVKAKVNDRDEMITSSKAKYTVKPSILTDLDEAIEDHDDYPLFLKLMEEVKVINETAHELDTTIRTLQSDMIDANNEMKTNEEQRKANEVLRETNEATRISQENARQEYLNAFDGKWEEYKADTDADIADYKAQIDAQESVRNTQEQQRQANEQRRITNEDERKVAENQRKANEFERRTNEAERKSTEANRVSAENARTNAEEQRQANEANREVAEEIRRANEEARITAENARVTEHEQMRTELNEVKAENAVLMENDKKLADRMTQVEISDKRQYVIMEGLMNSAGDGYLKIEDTGNDTTLYNSVEGFVDVKNITGNTMVNSIKNPDDEFTLNADINTSGQSVTLTTAVDNGQVDVLAEGNTMVNVCDQQEAVAITKSYTVENGNHVALQGEYDGKARPVVTGNTLVNLVKKIANQSGNDWLQVSTLAYDISGKTITIINKSDKSISFQWSNPDGTYGGNISIPGNSSSVKIMSDSIKFRMIQGRYSDGWTSNDLEEFKKSIIILEGDYTNKPIPDYFTGMQSSFEDKVVTQEMVDNGKELAENLGKYRVDYKVTGKNKLDSNNLYIFNDNKYIGTTNAIPILPNTDYKFSYIIDGCSSYDGRISLYDKNKKLIERINDVHSSFNSGNAFYLQVYIGQLTNDNGSTFKDLTTVNVINIQLEEGTVYTTYEPYKESIKTYYLNSPLLEGDTIEESNGNVYHVHRYKEVVLDGSSDENWYIAEQENTYRGAFENIGGNPNKNTCICAIFKNKNYWDEDVEGIWADRNLILSLSKSKINSTYEFTSYLQTNPVIAVYELASPTYELISQSDTILTDSYVAGHLDFDTAVPVERVKFEHKVIPLEYLYPSTNYVLQFESDNVGEINVYLSDWNYDISVSKGLNKINLTTISNSNILNRITFNGIGFNMSNIVVTEATDKDFGYFSGMKSVGELEENTIEIVSANGTDSTAEGYLSNSKQILLNEPLRAVGDTKDRFVQIDGKWYVERNCAERNYETDDETNTSYKTDKIKTVYTLASPTYEPVEIAPTVNTYTDVTHITNNSTIPMNMPIVNSGYELIVKPSTKYTVVGIDSGRIGDSTIVNGTITTPATITDNFLRPYGTGKTSKVMLLKGEPANIPGYFKGIKSVFEDKVTEDGKYAVEVKVYNDLGEETKQTLYLDEPLYNTNNITIYNDKLGYWKNYDIRDYQDGDFGTYLTDMTKTVYQLAEPVFIPLIDNCPNWVIGSWDNCSIHFDSIIPLLATRYRYTGNVPSVVAMSDDVAETKSISDEQDAMIVDLATQVATMEMMLM